MTEKSIVQQLLKGSEAIDWMNREIRSVVSMVLGMISDPEVTIWTTTSEGRRRPRTVFPVPGGKWEFTIGNLPYSLYVSFSLIDDSRNPPIENLVYASSPHHVSLRYTQKVHAALPVFVEGMIKTFPNLASRLQPFLDAADK